MALTHHLIVQISSYRAYKRGTSDYCLLGDDIVIFDPIVAEHYQKILIALDMPISEQKTHISYDTFEFCKR